MSKAQSPQKTPESPTPGPVGRGAVCLAACFLVNSFTCLLSTRFLSLVSRPLYI